MADREVTFSSNSGNITAISYDDDTQDLTVTFGERVYIYHNVPESTALGFESAPSAGQYLNQFIKPTFSWDRG